MDMLAKNKSNIRLEHNVYEKSTCASVFDNANSFQLEKNNTITFKVCYNRVCSEKCAGFRFVPFIIQLFEYLLKQYSRQ